MADTLRPEDLDWEEPRIVHRGTGLEELYTQIELMAPALKLRHGDWAVVEEFTSKTMGSSRSQQCSKRFPKLEFAGRRTGEGSKLYVRSPPL